MEELLLRLLQLVLIIAVSLITKFLCSFLSEKCKEIVATVKNRKTRVLLSQALDAVSKAVAYVNQTYVDELKKSDAFSRENQEEAFRRAAEAAKSLMTEEVVNYIDFEYGEFSGWLTAQVEAEVRAQKDSFAVPIGANEDQEVVFEITGRKE